MDTMSRKHTSHGVSIVLRKIMLLILILCGGLLRNSSAQIFWTESFGTGCSQHQLAGGLATTNGTWTQSLTGTNDPFANEWYVSATENGFPPGTCRDGCLTNGTLTNQTLHVGNVAGSPNAIVLCATGDCAAAYDPGGFTPNQVTTHKRIESPVINCTGKSNILLSFNYFENGDLLSDNATVWYFDGSTWFQLVDPPKTSTATCSSQGVWTAFNTSLPASANNNANVIIGFEWVNNDDATGTSPSFVADEITLSTVASSVVADFSVDSVSGG